MNSTRSIAELLDEGLLLHRAEKYEAAGALYRQVLESSPEHAEALHFLGLPTAQQGEMPSAVELIQRALKLATFISGEPAGGFPSWFVVKK